MTVQDPNVVPTSGTTTPAVIDPAGANARAEQIIDVVAEDRGDGVSVVSVGGEVDMLSAPELRSAVRTRLDDSTVLVLDMTRVRFLGSAGLAVLVEALQQSKRRGTAFHVVAVDRAVIRPLIATGLGDVFSVFPTVDEALAAQR